MLFLFHFIIFCLNLIFTNFCFCFHIFNYFLFSCFVFVWCFHNFIPRLAWSNLKHINKWLVIAVSYTHLDVYKRQGMEKGSTSMCLCIKNLFPGNQRGWVSANFINGVDQKNVQTTYFSIWNYTTNSESYDQKNQLAKKK